QEFPVDAQSIALFTANAMQVSNTNIWAVEVTAQGFAYELRRQGRWFRVEFDLTHALAPPPAAWGALSLPAARQCAAVIKGICLQRKRLGENARHASRGYFPAHDKGVGNPRRFEEIGNPDHRVKQRAEGLGTLAGFRGHLRNCIDQG